MIRFVNAKINLGLFVTAKRPDGYHELETLFYPVGLYNGTPENPDPFCDILEIHLRDHGQGDEFFFYGEPIDCPTDKNLIVRASRLFNSRLRERRGKEIGMIISLDKHIPDGAGLGGGSADASFVLLSLNDLCGKPFSKEELIPMAKSLGADCPFFIRNRPVIATGIGEVMTPVDLNLTGCWCVIVKPDIHISTKDAFAGIVPAAPSRHIADIISGPIDKWEEDGLKNDFEKHIFRLHPSLEGIKNRLREHGASYAAMSGSGSSLFGIFNSKTEASASLKAFDSPAFLIKL